ncbi:hypothetical protein P7K49_027889 [Saguinus oedipus]|uniref:Uncharacterized protein n=1 Tax=Saguinus oedipus TaxID=9490 RepID=A0ABQ9UAR8_SAGOE|nr:hypothetical protein P7K49_027889 [Saguinus oedipus]
MTEHDAFAGDHTSTESEFHPAIQELQHAVRESHGDMRAENGEDVGSSGALTRVDWIVWRVCSLPSTPCSSPGSSCCCLCGCSRYPLPQPQLHWYRTHSVRTVQYRTHSVRTVQYRTHSVRTVQYRTHSVLTVQYHGCSLKTWRPQERVRRSKESAWVGAFRLLCPSHQGPTDPWLLSGFRTVGKASLWWTLR